MAIGSLRNAFSQGLILAVIDAQEKAERERDAQRYRAEQSAAKLCELGLEPE